MEFSHNPLTLTFRVRLVYGGENLVLQGPKYLQTEPHYLN